MRPTRAGREPQRPLFLLATLLVPVLFFAALELVLRVVGFGGSYPLFVDAADLPGQRYANTEVIRRYVACGREPLAKIDPIPFQSEKPANGYRIVVQGGSTAAGFPYGRWGGLAGMLGDRLEASFPDREIEVITTAMAAVNSYTLADLADEIVEIEPDAVLIYAGHNEFLGILGVGSALAAGSSRAAVELRLRLTHSRVYQLIRQIVALARNLAAVVRHDDRNSLFALAARGSQIPFGSETYAAGLAQFKANMSSLLETYQRAGIPVYIGTLVGNEKDQEPFVGGPSEDVPRARWDELWAEYSKHRAAGALENARAVLRKLIELDEDSADAWYALGRLEQALGRPRQAREAYLGAKDRDRLRFRAPEDLNRLVRWLASAYGATVVEVQQRFVVASQDGMIGSELLLDHVHPNAEGYFLLADAYYEALKRDGRIGDWSSAPSRAAAERDMPLTALDRILAEYDALEIKAGFPFEDPPRRFQLPAPRNEIERLAQARRKGEIDWINSMERLLQIYQRRGRLADAARVARLTAQAYPAERVPNYAAGELLRRLGKLKLARRYLERSLSVVPDHPATLASLVEVDRALGNPERARERLALLEAVQPDHPLVREAKAANRD